MAEWTLLGPVVKTQIHTDRMVNGGCYEAEKILEVDALWLGPDGVLGVVGEQVLVQAHHRLHPNKVRSENTKRFLPARLVSFGFTGHYDAMAERFGNAPIGCAAEDFIIEHDGIVPLSQLTHGVQVRRPGTEAVIELEGIAVAKPCVAFTRYMLGDQAAPDDVVVPNRAFLDRGIRGFVMGLANRSGLGEIRTGDEFWIRT